MRGFGNPQGNFAVESVVDMMAERLGMDPVELRLKNVMILTRHGFRRIPVPPAALRSVWKRGRRRSDGRTGTAF